MTENEFRIKYSQLMQYYQLIEFHLKGLCAQMLADDFESWFENMSEHEDDSFGRLVKEIRKIQKKKQAEVFTEDDFVELSDLRENRNYWVHQCFYYPNETLQVWPISFRNGEVRDSVYAQMINDSLDNAMMWDERIVEKNNAFGN